MSAYEIQMTYHGSIPKLMVNGDLLDFQAPTCALRHASEVVQKCQIFQAVQKWLIRLNPIMDNGKSTEDANNVLRLCDMSR